MTDVETRTKLNIWYQTLKEETAVSDASLFSFIFNCSLLQDNHFQVLLRFGNVLLFFFFFLAVWCLQEPLYIYMSFHKVPSYNNRFGFWLRELDARVVHYNVPVAQCWLKIIASQSPSELLSASHMVSTQDVFAELTRQHPTTNLWNEVNIYVLWYQK